jgi:hypothetical protein
MLRNQYTGFLPVWNDQFQVILKIIDTRCYRSFIFDPDFALTTCAIASTWGIDLVSGIP